MLQVLELRRLSKMSRNLALQAEDVHKKEELTALALDYKKKASSRERALLSDKERGVRRDDE